MIGGFGSSGARFAVLNLLANQAQLASPLPAAPSGAVNSSAGAGWGGAQHNVQATVPNAISAPDRAAQVDFGAPSKPGTVQPPVSVDGSSFPAQAGQYHSAEVARAKPTAPQAAGGLPGSIKDMVGGLQNEFAEMQRITSMPIAVPNIPGGEEFARTLNDTLHYQQMSLEFEIGMSLGGDAEKNTQKMSEKILDMKE